MQLFPTVTVPSFSKGLNLFNFSKVSRGLILSSLSNQAPLTLIGSISRNIPVIYMFIGQLMTSIGKLVLSFS